MMALTKSTIMRGAMFAVLGFIFVGCSSSPSKPKPALRIVVQDYKKGQSAVRSANPDVKLTMSTDAQLANSKVLVVDYPVPTVSAGGRDVYFRAKNKNWSKGQAISFQIKPDHKERLSVSFFDTNGVAYTHWVDLQGGVWQPVRIPFNEMKPNPYFQPAEAKTGGPIKVTKVKGIAFAPQDPLPGRLVVGEFVVTD
jgi:hypothetical protein